MMQLKKKKWALTVYCTLIGTAVAVMTDASLGDWSVFALAMIGAFGVADVSDKKLNGGAYDSTTPVEE